MAIVFQNAHLPPLAAIRAAVPGGAIIGVFGDDVPAQSALMRLAAGAAEPLEGEVSRTGPVRWLRPYDALDLSPVENLVLDHALALQPNWVKACAARDLERLRRAGSAILISAHEEAWLRLMCDEIWWIEGGRLAGKAEPGEAFRNYHQHLARRIRAAGEGQAPPLSPTLRRGNGAAVVETVELHGSGSVPTSVLQSGEEAAVHIRVRYQTPAPDPVLGIMIRTRIGFEVYGTNTALENLKLGPVGAGATLEAVFRFRVNLCPGDYTLTVAAHDPDGVWHDWLEDALAFSVTDTRHTAGVANLHAEVSFRKID